ncbi:hypothetical protein HPP92_028846 [Vanilla planifolia]|uniref:Uncharacterized protein n=1 Tax=Vanilla planifolia TaxID=51239 RepID=A0A835P7N3_VANPL|nr:hypothetical protein HPP92_028846 [Vanilla planifolia]KAG0446418.1 hypothetical protein HPP92_028835 [Vanilla planifolia]
MGGVPRVRSLAASGRRSKTLGIAGNHSDEDIRNAQGVIVDPTRPADFSFQEVRTLEFENLQNLLEFVLSQAKSGDSRIICELKYYFELSLSLSSGGVGMAQ